MATKDIPAGTAFVSGDTAPVVRTKLNDNLVWAEEQLQGIEDRLEQGLIELVGVGVLRGLAVSPGEGLSVSVAPGAAFLGVVVVVATTVTAAVPAGEESTVYLLQDGSLVASTSGPPTEQAALMLATVVTDLAGVVSVDNDPAGKPVLGLLPALGAGEGIAATLLAEGRVLFDSASGHTHDGADSAGLAGTPENAFAIGDGTSGTKALYAATGAAARPGLRFHGDESRWEYSNDGAAWSALGAGGGGGTPADSVVAETAFGLAPSAGLSTDYARGDHTHGSPSLAGSTPTAVAAGGSGSAGAAEEASRSDHAHAVSTAAAGAVGDVDGAEGTASTLARSDHRHAAFDTTAPASVGSTAAVGSATRAARRDHVHQGVHSIARSGSGQLSGDVLLAQGPNISLSQSGQTITISATAGTVSLGDTVQPETSFGQAASAGMSLAPSRADHTHGTPSLGGSTGQVQYNAGGSLGGSGALAWDTAAGRLAVTGEGVRLRRDGAAAPPTMYLARTETGGIGNGTVLGRVVGEGAVSGGTPAAGAYLEIVGSEAWTAGTAQGSGIRLWVVANGGTQALQALHVRQDRVVQCLGGLQVDGDVTLGSASGDTIALAGRAVLRTLATDPLHATAASRPAGSTGEIAYYAGQAYVCSSGAVPVWKRLQEDKSLCLARCASDVDVAVGDGLHGLVVGSDLAGYEVVGVVATVATAGATGSTQVQLRRRRGDTGSGSDVDVLSTRCSIDDGERSSTTAATAAVVDTGCDDLAAGDLLFVDVDAVSATPPKGLSVAVVCRLPQ